jgi:hemerythrin-like domain-containing protein
MDRTRRAALAVGIAAAAALPGACAKADAGNVSATEDMMREHGVLRRLLIVYRESAGRLTLPSAGFDFAALAQAADLFRRFGEDYHESRLEEAYVFPAVSKAGGAAAALIAPLLAQHRRGREINAFVSARCRAGAGGDAGPLARALESFARMYEAHAAMEDTVVYQAWRRVLPKARLAEMADRFEDIEKAQFKGDGFDLAVAGVSAIEQRLGLAGLDRYTAPEPAPR